MGWWNRQWALIQGASWAKWFLVASNLVPLAGVLLGGWDLGLVMLAFWLENVVVGGYSILRMAVIMRWGALFFAPFFAFHYGMFTFVHGIFVVGFFVATDGFGFQILSTLQTYASPLSLVGGSLVVSHGVSFAQNFIRGKEWQLEKNPGMLMGAAYKRVIVLHAVLVLGAFPMLLFGQPIWGLLLLVALKLVVDLWSHAREHHVAS